jgi:hypothetical protein
MPSVNLDELRLEVAGRLPVRVRWLLDETPWDWDFSRARQALQPLSDADAETWMEILPEDWRQLYIFGEEAFAAGGGARPFLGVHIQSGEVYGLDVERDDAAAYFLNSSVPAFIDTFLLFDEVLGKRVAATSRLSDRARAADPKGFDRSEWRDAAEHVEFLSGGA